MTLPITIRTIRRFSSIWKVGEYSLTTQTTLELIEQELKKIDPKTFYGTAAKIKRNEPWDYIVFSRENATMNDNLTSISMIYPVAVVRENYVPEGLEDQIILAMRNVPGMKPTGEIVFDYMTKPGTSDVVEMMVIRFRKSRKICL